MKAHQEQRVHPKDRRVRPLRDGIQTGPCIFLALLLAACTTFSPRERGQEELPLPDSYTLYGPTASAPERWWEAFGSEELDRLVDETLAGNFTLQQAVARIRQAAAIAQQRGALRWPELGYNAEASATRTHTDTGERAPKLEIASQHVSAFSTLLSGRSGPTSATSTAATPLQSAQSRLQALNTLLSDTPSSERTFTTESYLAGLTAGYELDVWGRLRASHRSAQLDWEALREDLYAVMQSVAGQVALTWIDLLEARQSLAVVDDQLAANNTTLELVVLRYRKGLATALDVYQQRQAVARSEAAIPPLEAQRDTLLQELAVLIGKPPRTDLALEADAYPDPGVLPEQGLPAGLLAQRPDVRAAGLRLRSADWQVSAARADRLPALRLTGSAGYNAQEWELLFDNWMARLAGSITGPIFDAGRRKAEVARTRAVADERLAAYRQSVVVAVGEVEAALVREAKQREYVEALERECELAQATHREALGRYRKGLNDYLPVLSALTNVQTLERTLVRARHDVLVHRVQLHLALGGGWMRARSTKEEGTTG